MAVAVARWRWLSLIAWNPPLPRRHGTVALVCRRWLGLSRRPSLLRSLTFSNVKTTHCDWLAGHAVEHVQRLVMYDSDCSEATLAAVLARCTQLTSLRAYSVGEWADHALPKLQELRVHEMPREATLPRSLTLLELDLCHPVSLSRQVRWWVWCPGGSLLAAVSRLKPPPLSAPPQLPALVALRDLRVETAVAPGDLGFLSRLSSSLQRLSLADSATLSPDTLCALTGLTSLRVNPGDSAALLQALTALSSLRDLTLVSFTTEGALPAGVWLKGLRHVTANWAVLRASLPALETATSLESLCALPKAEAPWCDIVPFIASLHTSLARLCTLRLPSVHHFRDYDFDDDDEMDQVHDASLQLQAARPSLRITSRFVFH